MDSRITTIENYVVWLRSLAKKGGKGVVGNIDARSLGHIATILEAYLDKEKRERENPDELTCNVCGGPRQDKVLKLCYSCWHEYHATLGLNIDYPDW